MQLGRTAEACMFNISYKFVLKFKRKIHLKLNLTLKKFHSLGSFLKKGYRNSVYLCFTCNTIVEMVHYNERQ